MYSGESLLSHGSRAMNAASYLGKPIQLSAVLRSWYFVESLGHDEDEIGLSHVQPVASSEHLQFPLALPQCPLRRWLSTNGLGPRPRARVTAQCVHSLEGLSLAACIKRASTSDGRGYSLLCGDLRYRSQHLVRWLLVGVQSLCFGAFQPA